MCPAARRGFKLLLVLSKRCRLGGFLWRLFFVNGKFVGFQVLMDTLSCLVPCCFSNFELYCHDS